METSHVEEGKTKWKSLGNSGYLIQRRQGCLGPSDLTFLVRKHAGLEDWREKEKRLL